MTVSEDDQVPFAFAPPPAPDPVAVTPPPPPPPPPGPRPAPLPMAPPPMAVTGVRPGWSDPLRAVVITMAVTALMGLLAAGFVTYLMLHPIGAASAPLQNAITARARADYPGWTVIKTDSRSLEGTMTHGVREIDVYVALRNVHSPGFEWTTVYHAVASSAATASDFENGDSFFMKRPFDQPVDSFIVMWLDKHPGEDPYFIYELGEASDATRTYEVSYARSESTGGRVRTVEGTYHYSYDTAGDRWVETTSPDEAGAPTGQGPSAVQTTTADAESDAPAAEPATPDPADADPVYIAADGSITNTQAMVAHALPGFVAFDVATTSQGEPLVVVRSKAYPGLVLVADPLYLDPPDPEDGIVALFGTKNLKGRKFAAFWTAKRPGAIVDYIAADPDVTGDTDYFDVTYVRTLDQVDDYPGETDVFLRWNPKTKTWGFSK